VAQAWRQVHGRAPTEAELAFTHEFGFAQEVPLIGGARFVEVLNLTNSPLVAYVIFSLLL